MKKEINITELIKTGMNYQDEDIKITPNEDKVIIETDKSIIIQTLDKIIINPKEKEDN